MFVFDVRQYCIERQYRYISRCYIVNLLKQFDIIRGKNITVKPVTLQNLHVSIVINIFLEYINVFIYYVYYVC